MIRFLHIGHRKQRKHSDPGFSSALDRVREIREHADWQPLADPATIHERGDRVAEKRREITIPPLAHERETRSERIRSSLYLQDTFRSILYGTGLVVGTIALVSLIPFRESKPVAPPPPPNIQRSTVAFLLADFPQYASLTEVQASEFAQKALTSAGLDWSAWRGVSDKKADTVPELYLQRVSDYEVTFHFRHFEWSYAELHVRVKLDPEDKYILCTITPK